MFAVLLWSCSGSGVILLGGDDTGERVPVSTFGSGHFTTTSLAVLDVTEGMDLDGDGEVDNQAPALLALLDPFAEDDMSLEGVNTRLEEMLEAEELLLLLDAQHVDPVLTIDLLLATRDEETDVLVLDPGSHDRYGDPTSHFVGWFSDEVTFETGADRAELPFPVARGGAPVPIPLADALLVGTMDAEAASGLVAGALPVLDLVDQVVEPLVPEEGPAGGYDPDDFLGMSRPEFIDWVHRLLGENIADLWLEDGSPAISAGLSWEVTATDDWPK